MARRGSIDLLRLVDLLQAHVTPALCHAAFGRVRKTERQRAWTLDALVRFWIAVILRAPKALRQALADAREEREPLFPRVPATPEAFFQRCRDLRPSFFAEVFRRFTARVVAAVPPHALPPPTDEEIGEISEQVHARVRRLLRRRGRLPEEPSPTDPTTIAAAPAAHGRRVAETEVLGSALPSALR